MKLSEALREGAKKHKQHFGYYEGPDDSRCAVGAIFSALGMDRIWESTRMYREALPILFDSEFDVEGNSLMDQIIALNDGERKSFEEIAQWLESEEL